LILLDTNLISELLQAKPEQRVITWFDAQSLETLCLSTIVVAELRYGVTCLAPGRRRKQLHASLEQRLFPLFIGRILSFDMTASEAYAVLMAKARTQGCPLAVADGYIAAIAQANGLCVATRDTKPFATAGVPVINPWDEDLNVN
jgi:toxin FitB